MANFSAPTTGNLYADVVGLINAKISDLALSLDPATTNPTNLPTNSIRWNSAANRFEKWNGSAWAAASTLYAIAISGNSATATTLQTARAINGTSFNGGSDITTTNWGTARVLTIGDTGKSVNGSAAVSWSLTELGVKPRGTVESVFSYAMFGSRLGADGNFANATLDSPIINKGGAGLFTAPRAGHVRCRVARFSYSVTSGSVTQAVLRFRQNTLFNNPEFYCNGTGVYSSAEAWFACAAGDVFAVGVLVNGGGVGSVTLAGISFEMMD